jgi:DNA-binding MarR family transcriptional regulator
VTHNRGVDGSTVTGAGGNLALDVFVLHQHLGALLDEALAGTGITPAQYAVYSGIGARSSSPGRLVAQLGIRPGTLSGYLTAMEQRGHLTRRRASADRRGHVIELTADGRAALEAARVRFRRAVGRLVADVGGADEAGLLREALGRLDTAVLAGRR